MGLVDRCASVSPCRTSSSSCSSQRLCDDAALYASIKADGYTRTGNIFGEQMWKRILIMNPADQGYHCQLAPGLAWRVMLAVGEMNLS